MPAPEHRVGDQLRRDRSQKDPVAVMPGRYEQTFTPWHPPDNRESVIGEGAQARPGFFDVKITKHRSDLQSGSAERFDRVPRHLLSKPDILDRRSDQHPTI